MKSARNRSCLLYTSKDGYRQINVEVYGGAILNTWLDRPLSAAGRVTLRSEDIFHPEIRYVDFRKPFLTIPNLAIHINKDVNKGGELNRQKEMCIRDRNYIYRQRGYSCRS